MTIQQPIMDARSEANLVHVHPDLCKVIRAASQTQPFIVIHGIRTPEQEKVYVTTGKSQTTHSRHLPNKQGFACAVDIACLSDGHITWEVPAYRQAWASIQAAAHAHQIPVEWGGAWKTLKDWGHFQLPWATYP